MYDYFKGLITNITPNNISLEINNIGYLIKHTRPFLCKIGEVKTIYVYFHIKEDIQELYGFETIEERFLFLKLLTVNGIGPKLALTIIASNSTSEVQNAIISQNHLFFQRCPGIGLKVSQQIILDLAGKLINSNISTKLSNIKEALVNLGYKNDEIKRIQPLLEANEILALDELLKFALKELRRP